MIISQTGDFAIRVVEAIIGMTRLFFECVSAIWRLSKPTHRLNKALRNQIANQILFTGVEAFMLIGFVALIVGCLVIIQSINNMPDLGVGEYFGNLLRIFVVRELGPIVVFLIVLGRSGTAFTAYVGNMKINKEITALESMGIEPVEYMVMPTMVGMIISVICLNFYFGMISLVGGLAVAKLLINIPFFIFLLKAINTITVFDAAYLCVKGIISGSIIAITASYFGLSVKNIREVSMVVIKTFVVAGACRLFIKVLMLAALVKFLFPEFKL